MQLGGVRLDLSRVKIPIYELFTKEDHIAPAASVFRGSKLFGGPVRHAMAGSGHIAGVVNPPSRTEISVLVGRKSGVARGVDGNGARNGRLVVARLGVLACRLFGPQGACAQSLERTAVGASRTHRDPM